MSHDITAELDGIDLGDRRRNDRSKRVLRDLAADPQASINAACNGWADTLGAYRFFDNDHVPDEELLRPHTRATLRRASAYRVVLDVQDTTELDYSDHPPHDARCLDKPTRFGLYAHMRLAITPDKLILGVLGIEYFDRAPESLGKTAERATLPIEEKESLRWLTGYRGACQVAAEIPATQVVSIADREGDIYDIFVAAQQQAQQAAQRAEFVIRARLPRSTMERDPEAGKDAYCKVRAEVAAAPLLTTRVVELPQTPKRAARTARLEIRAVTVLVKPPHARSYLPPVTLNVVLAQEVGGPGDGTDVCWLLLTSLPIATVAEVLLVIDYYVARWGVEIYFRTWKTGCKIEDIQLEKVARLKRCLALYALVAWRVLYLTYQNRSAPKASCEVAFSAEEWQTLWRVVCQQPLPQEPPCLGEVLRLLSELGGYNNRAKEPPPGPQPIWVGLRRLADFVLAWQAFTQNR